MEAFIDFSGVKPIWGSLQRVPFCASWCCPTQFSSKCHGFLSWLLFYFYHRFRVMSYNTACVLIIWMWNPYACLDVWLEHFLSSYSFSTLGTSLKHNQATWGCLPFYWNCFFCYCFSSPFICLVFSVALYPDLTCFFLLPIKLSLILSSVIFLLTHYVFIARCCFIPTAQQIWNILLLSQVLCIFSSLSWEN